MNIEFEVHSSLLVRLAVCPYQTTKMILYRRCALLLTTLAVALELSEGFQTPKATRSLLFQSRQSVRRATSEGNNSAPVPTKSRTLLETLDEAGQSLKPRAVKASAKASLVEKKGKKILYVLETCGLYSLFILYRAYRGFFVLLPAVFREVYSRMSATVDSPFESADLENSGGGNRQDINPETGKLRWRTRITVSLLAMIVTASYVIGGALRVLTMFARTITQTSSVSGSFAAAADEQESNEDKIMRMANKQKSINGEQPPPKPSSPSGLAP
jgi:hypothetical protein